MVKHGLENMEDYVDESNQEESFRTSAQLLERHAQDKRWGLGSPELYAQLCPPRLMLMLATLAFFILKYYTEHCVSTPAGGLVSGAIMLPKSSQMSFMSFLLDPLPFSARLRRATACCGRCRHGKQRAAKK